MIEIKDILQNISNVLLKADIKCETVRTVIGETIGLNIKREDIQIKNNIIYLNIKPLFYQQVQVTHRSI